MPDEVVNFEQRYVLIGPSMAHPPTNRCFQRTEKGFKCKVQQFQKPVQEHNEAAVATANTLAASFKTITTAHAEYTKKLLQDGSEFFSKLTKVNSTDQAMKLQNDYAKSAYEAFVTEIKKVF